MDNMDEDMQFRLHLEAMAREGRLVDVAEDMYAATVALSEFLKMFEAGAFKSMMVELKDEPGMFKLIRSVQTSRKLVDETLAKVNGRTEVGK